MSELPESDLDFLQEKEYEYQIIPENGILYLIISKFKFPELYTPNEAEILIKILPNYPNTPLDMFWTIPDIKKINGEWPAASNQKEIYVGSAWQRWSRHYQWRAGIDNLRTFISSIQKEVNKGL